MTTGLFVAQATRTSGTAPAVLTAAPAAATSSQDLALNGWGDGNGYHLDLSSGSSGYAWREIAVLHPDGIDDRSWTGYQCLSGDGKYAAVALMPISATNTPSLRAHGAFAYTVNTATGAVHPVAAGVALEYFSPSCGTADTAVFSISSDDFASSTELLSVAMATGAVQTEARMAGQVTSTVATTQGRLVGVRGDSLVQITGQGPDAKTVTIATLPAGGYDLQPAADGGVDLLTSGATGTATAWHETAGKLTQTATGTLTGMALFHGRAGTNILTGATAVGAAHGIRVVTDRGLPGQPVFASLDGGAVFSDSKSAKADQPTADITSGPSLITPKVTGPAARADAAVPTFVPDGVPDPIQQAPAPGSTPAPADTGGAGTAQLTAYVETAQTPVCAVARLNPSMQVPQPNAAQVDWATQMDEQGLLTGSTYQRPANFDNMGLVAYAPSSDFAPIALDHPSGDSWNTVPRSVMEAILAQESNWDQASWHALPGISGDPLIADYYGAQGTITNINYGQADCGYGIAQVTNGMETGESTYSVHGQMKIANDYEENIAAGLQILESTWNQLYTAGKVPLPGVLSRPPADQALLPHRHGQGDRDHPAPPRGDSPATPVPTTRAPAGRPCPDGCASTAAPPPSSRAVLRPAGNAAALAS